jgi:hypothetical protein
MISATMRLLLEKYQPDSPLLNEQLQEPSQAPVSVELNKQASTLTLAQRIAVMKAQGYPQIIIEILEQQMKVNMAKERK